MGLNTGHQVSALWTVSLQGAFSFDH